jgi:hypothetical protein
VVLFVPTFAPFTFHWKTGRDPPFIGVAVKVTLIPWQTGFWDATIDKLTGRFGFTVIVIVFDMAGFPVTQLELEVNVQVIVFPFKSPLVV